MAGGEACPHCGVIVAFAWQKQAVGEPAAPAKTALQAAIRRANSNCTNWFTWHAWCPGCKRLVIRAVAHDKSIVRVVPQTAPLRSAPPAVPTAICADYVAAAKLVELCPPASAAMSRRCLQHVLHDRGIIKKDLNQEIAAFLAGESHLNDLLKQLLDHLRQLGNFAAHPKTDWHTAEIIEVEDHEAELCLDLLDALFDHVYVQPAAIAAKREELDKKFARAKKPKES